MSAATSPKGEVWGQSAMTLRTGNVSFTFGKAQRFFHRRVETQDLVGVLPSTLNARTTSFGFGNRWTPINLTGKDSPPPNTYEIQSGFDTTHKSGFSFGSRLGHRVRKESPGPGTYEVAIPAGKNAPKFTFRPRVMTRKKSVSPPPDTYRPSTSLIQSGRYKDIGFGFGERIVPLNKGRTYSAVKDFPGPGTYNLASALTPVRNHSRVRSRHTHRANFSVPTSPAADD